ncbi:glycosyltransferase [Marinilabilia sp.]
MVIAVFIKELRVGGAEKQSLLLARELQKEYETYLIVWSRNILVSHYQDFIEQHGVRTVFLEGTILKKVAFLWKFFRQKRVTHLFNFLLLNNLVGGLVGRLAGVKKIYGGIRNCEIVPSKLAWQRFLHNNVSHYTIFNNVSGTVQLVNQGFRKDKMLVIQNGIDVNGSIPEKRGKTVPVIFTAARFLPQKDYSTALQAIKYLKEKKENFRYVIAGYGQQEAEIKKMIVDLGLSDFVEVKIAPPNIKELYHQADIYLTTSLREGFSNSIMEALASGLPVVATSVGDNEYLVEDGKNGFVLPVKAPEKIGEALKKLIENETMIREMGQTGYQHLKEKFSTRHFFNRYKELLTYE